MLRVLLLLPGQQEQLRLVRLGWHAVRHLVCGGVMRSRWVCAPPVSPYQANPNKEPALEPVEPAFVVVKRSKLVLAAPVHGVAKHRVVVARA